MQRPLESKTQFPIHSFLSHFPVGLWAASFVLDAIVLARPDQLLLAQASTIMLWTGMLSAVIAAMFGWRDYNTRVRVEHPEALRVARTHLSLNVFLVFWYAVLASLRSFGQPIFGLMSGLDFLMAAIGFGVLLRSAVLGHRLVFLFRVGQVTGEMPPGETPRVKRPDQAA
jgi:uncharacterized membrane protein